MVEFVKESDVAPVVEQIYGRYVATFKSEHGQVEATLFEVDGNLIAHVSYAAGLRSENVTDDYLSPLVAYAERNGYGGKLRLIHFE